MRTDPARTILLLSLFAGCSPSPVAPAVGNLSIVIDGLAGAPARVSVTGPHAFNRTATETITFTGIPTGRYAVASSKVAASGSLYVPSAAATEILVDAAATTVAAVTYARARYELLYVTDRATLFHDEVYAMNADGTAQTDLTNDSAAEGEPAWSPDGQRIAFTSGRDGNVEIYTMNADGSAAHRVTNSPADDRAPSWSPDGGRLAFLSMTGTSYSIIAADADGSNIANLTAGLGVSASLGVGVPAAWSPDGTKIAFVGRRTYPNDNVYVIGADGTGLVELTDSIAGGLSPAWSPDGTRIAFLRARIVCLARDPVVHWRCKTAITRYNVIVMNADGSAPMPLTADPGVNGSGPPAWTPDGTRIVYGVGDQIMVMGADGTNAARLVGGTGGVSWSSDGGHIAFTATGVDGRAQIFVANADGSAVTQLTRAVADVRGPIWRPIP